MNPTIPTTLTNDAIITLAPAAGSFEPVAKASNRYSFVPTLTVVDALREVGWFPIAAEQSNARLEARYGFQQHMIRFARHGVPGKGERVDMLLWNSHDLGSSFKLITSVWRYACGNGLMVSSEFANFTHRHVGFNLDELVRSALEIAEESASVAEQVEAMKTITLTPDERGVFAASAHQLVYDVPGEAPVRPEQLLTTRRFDDRRMDDLWTTFNIVQENVIKGGVRGMKFDEFGRHRRVTTRPVKALDRNVKLNQALWFLTEKMRELKSSDNN
jgi:Domain of unknown function (DUF932)